MSINEHIPCASYRDTKFSLYGIHQKLCVIIVQYFQIKLQFNDKNSIEQPDNYVIY